MTQRDSSTPMHGVVERVLDILPILTTLLLLSIYPLLRYLPGDPFWSEVFRFAVITLWIGYLIINQVRAHKTRQELLANMETDWCSRIETSGHSLSHYAILMPLKRENNRRVLFQAMRSIERQRYPMEQITLIPIVEAEDRETLHTLRDLLPTFEKTIRIRLFTYPTDGIVNRCKATSISAAGRYLARQIDDGALRDEDLKILIIDADTILHPQDLAFREHSHRLEAERAMARGDRGVVLQSLTTYTSNYWKVPMLPRLHNSGFVLYQLGKMQTAGDYLVLGPGTSLLFRDFRTVDYFEPNRHNEDMQFRYKVVMEGFRVAPVKMPTWGQAPLTTRDSWGQIARWARGAVDVKFVVNYVRRFDDMRVPLLKRKLFLALRALFANAMPPLMVFLPAQLILISWISPCVKELWPFQVFLSPDVLALRIEREGLCVSPLAAFNLRFQTIVLTASMFLSMVLVPHTLKPIIYQRPPRRWRQSRKLFEWSRLTFAPINLHNYFLMATAQLYMQARLALGISITHTEVTRK